MQKISTPLIKLSFIVNRPYIDEIKKHINAARKYVGVISDFINIIPNNMMIE